MDPTTMVIMSIVFLAHEFVMFSMLFNGLRKTRDEMRTAVDDIGSKLNDDSWGMTMRLNELRQRKFAPKMK